MTDAAFVLGAYGVVIGGLLLYGATIERRRRAFRRTAIALRQARGRHADAVPRQVGAAPSGSPEAPP